MGKQTERIVNADRVEDLVSVFGSFDENIKRIEEALAVVIVNRGTDLKVSGDEEAVEKATYFLQDAIEEATREQIPRNHGVNFEKYLSRLL